MKNAWTAYLLVLPPLAMVVFHSWVQRDDIMLGMGLLIYSSMIVVLERERRQREINALRHEINLLKSQINHKDLGPQ